jgi:hypothetical protein
VTTPIPGGHLCFRAPDRAAVDALRSPLAGTTMVGPGCGRTITLTTTALRFGPRWPSHRDSLPCAEEPDDPRYGLAKLGVALRLLGSGAGPQAALSICSKVC